MRKYYLKVSVLCYAVWIVLFEAVGTYASRLETMDLSLGIDRLIPVSPVFVWPYHLCYVVPLLLVFVPGESHRINRAILSFFLASAIAFSVYLLLPVSFPRPDLGTGFSERFLAFAYSIDFYPGANKLPSLHVSMAWIVFLGCRRQRLGRIGDVILFVVAVAISGSTLLVKQHIVLDVISGALLGLIAWELTGWYYNRVIDTGQSGPGALRQVVRRLNPVVATYAACMLVLVGLIEIGLL